MDLPAGTSNIGFADDALVVCTTKDVGTRQEILSLPEDCFWGTRSRVEAEY